MIKNLKLTLLAFALAWTAWAQAGVAPYQFADPADQARFDRLSYELRCLVCQNQNLADSNAELAIDLRREIHTMIQQGQPDEEIIAFMVARYGDFVLYRPPVKPITYALWLGPFLLGAVGLLVMIRLIRQRTGEQAGGLSTAERERLRLALEGDDQRLNNP